MKMGNNLQHIVLINFFQPPGWRKKGERLRISDKMFEKSRNLIHEDWQLFQNPSSSEHCTYLNISMFGVMQKSVHAVSKRRGWKPSYPNSTY